ncbi:hypothetical protein EPA93_27190 [Ktedonosporobacter rubrisoli]|uniref:Uncharacterized protein n=1 Tax=Ktedonosporobacter rubrisoli TaxID=2509675 RepID=A0A4P6JUZ2_KTERU|nr:hypothetical protein [Ktedonosporobacter rubrisoli]QBD79469.1 hypothetical protein EPA93_27190 [Ktedonosporobacter rubrisoli]
MQPEEILGHARTNTDVPADWQVFPLLRNKLVIGLIGWAFGIIVGLGLFAAIVPIVIPTNYQSGTLPAITTTLLLALLLFIGLGSAWTLIVDIRRLRNANQHLIVITPDDFLKQEGKKIIHVPLTEVKYVTARGVPPPERDPNNEDANVHKISGIGENAASFFVGRSLLPSGSRRRRKRMRTPTSLAFIDARSEQEITVVTDTTFGDPFIIAAYLKQYAAAAQEALKSPAK